MNRLIKLVVSTIIYIGLTSLLSSCDDKSFSAGSSQKLFFSQDTIAFDTVFTSIGSATRILKVYNLGKEALHISSITLANASTSGFYVNVDGQKGSRFTDVEIQGKDSMYVFIEVKVDPQNNTNPIFIEDSLIFITNGVEQDVKLQAYGQDVLILRGKTLTRDTIFTAYRPILVYDSLRINDGVKLTCEAGTRMFFHSNAACLVHGSLQVDGTLQNSVLFRGDRLDNMFDNLPYDLVPGQWGGIRFYKQSFDNKLNYINIYGGNYGLQCDSSDVSRLKLTLTNSIIHNVMGNGLQMTSCKAQIANSQISNAKNNCVSLLGGDYIFVHCTFADYFSWSIRSGVALSIKNNELGINYPLYNALFYNSVIAGSSSDEVNGLQSTNTEIPFHYLFSHSLINSMEVKNSNIIDVVWKKDNNFLYIGETDYQYDFRPDFLSLAIGLGDAGMAAEYPLDLNGRSRLSDAAPDAGCYEWLSGDKSLYKK